MDTPESKKSAGRPEPVAEVVPAFLLFDFFFDFLCFIVDLNEDFDSSAVVVVIGVGLEEGGAEGVVVRMLEVCSCRSFFGRGAFSSTACLNETIMMQQSRPISILYTCSMETY